MSSTVLLVILGFCWLIALAVTTTDSRILWRGRIEPDTNMTGMPDEDLPEFDLPRAQSLIDCLFILVMACSDMKASLDWMAEHLDIAIGRDELIIVYTMLAKAFGLPEEDPHTISTMVHGKLGRTIMARNRVSFRSDADVLPTVRCSY